MKAVVRTLAEELRLAVEEVDVDSEPELAERYGNEVPVLCIDGRKAFKYRVTIRELRRKLLG
ncbi:MAG: glutaredoxin family protein [Deltaproteobacteria bacterium]|nr:glutaredoxin family protein [Deltaproteobacteria bacterium]